MKKDARAVTIMVHRDGDVESSSYRVPMWAIKTASITVAVLATGFLVTVALYGPIVRAAARVPFLTREISRLNAENEQVHHRPGSRIRPLRTGDPSRRVSNDVRTRLPSAGWRRRRGE